MHTLKMSLRRPAAVGGATAIVAAMLDALAPTAQAADPDPNHLSVIYDVVGSTHIGAQVDSDMDLGPTNIKVVIDTAAPLPTPVIDGSMAIPTNVMSFDVFGIPTRATVDMTQVGPVTGTLTKLPSPRQALDMHYISAGASGLTFTSVPPGQSMCFTLDFQEGDTVEVGGSWINTGPALNITTPSRLAGPRRASG